MIQPLTPIDQKGIIRNETFGEIEDEAVAKMVIDNLYLNKNENKTED